MNRHYGSVRPDITAEVTFALLFVTGGLVISLVYAALFPNSDAAQATLQVRGLCCTYVAQHAAERLLAVDGVLDVEPDFQKRLLTIQMRTDCPPPPRRLWEALEQTSVSPTRLVLRRATYEHKPVE